MITLHSHDLLIAAEIKPEMRNPPFVSLCFALFVAFAAQGCNTQLAPRTMPNLVAPLDFSQPQVFRFNSGEVNRHEVNGREVIAGEHRVAPALQYTEQRGYGFDLQTFPTTDNTPFYFSVAVPEGNYRVTVDVGHATLPSSNTVRAEMRRLYLRELSTADGEFIQHSFIVNVRNNLLQAPELNAPGVTRVTLKELEQYRLHWDNKLTLEFNGTAPQVRSVTIQQVDVPTMYLVGDSTVTDQPYEPAASWGQMLPYFFTAPLFKGEIAIANHAESGETMKSFITAGRFAKVLERIKPGDYLLIQFGHNDQKKQWPQTYVEATTTYKDYLKIFIGEAQLRGATPVLITSMQRRTFDQHGKIINSHGLYPQAVREVAQEKNITLIDLDALSIELYETLGVAQAPFAFNDNGKDATHHNSYGAYQLARCVTNALRQSSLPLAAALSNQPAYRPTQPDPVQSFVLAPSPQASTLRPDGN
jgi:lysophospholipase L1-like esterase